MKDVELLLHYSIFGESFQQSCLFYIPYAYAYACVRACMCACMCIYISHSQWEITINIINTVIIENVMQDIGLSAFYFFVTR